MRRVGWIQRAAVDRELGLQSQAGAMDGLEVEGGQGIRGDQAHGDGELDTAVLSSITFHVCASADRAHGRSSDSK